MPVELRLKGDWADHLVHDKWSFRIEMRGEHYVYGMSVFSIHDPSMRTYLNEWLFQQAMREEEVLSVSYRFVEVVLNGEYKGIYALEEGFAKELLESQQRRESVILRYAEDLLWTARALYDDQTLPPGIERFYVIDEFGTGKIARSPTLSAQRDAAVGLLRGFWSGVLSAPEVFDLETMGAFLALSDLWSAPHGLIWHNLRYYYNPVTAHLEPISFDSDPFSPELDFESVGLAQSAFYDDPHLQAAYVRALWRISQPGYVETLEAKFGAQFAAYAAALEPEFGAEVLAPPWDLLRRRQELIRQRLLPIQMTYAYALPQGEASLQSEVPSLQLDVGNLIDLPVEIVGLELSGLPSGNGTLFTAVRTWAASESDGKIVTATDALVLPALSPDAEALSYVRLQVPDAGPLDVPTTTMTLLTRVWGMTQTVTQTVRPSYPMPLTTGALPDFPALAEALALHPYLKLDAAEATLSIPPGIWDVEGDLILPQGYGLRLEAGTTLRFGPENFLLATGSLLFEGAADAPVLLQPQQDQWLGIVVLNSAAPSSWRYVTVEATNVIDREGWTLTGGITFYRSPIRLSHSRIVGTLAEDGLNVIRARFEFVDSEFAHTASDAFDADFAEGLIERCVFHDIDADAIDVSGSTVQVRDVRGINLGDKGLSVGENSRLTGERLTFENVDFGVVSKDLSRVTVSDVTIQGVRIAGLAAYIKKPSYGPASITADGVIFVDVPAEHQALVQTGSWIDLDGARIWGVDVDVDALYEKWKK